MFFDVRISSGIFLVIDNCKDFSALIANKVNSNDYFLIKLKRTAMKPANLPVKQMLVMVLCLIVITGCNTSRCKNTNPVFENQSPESEQYKAELAKQLGLVNMSKLTYWFNDYTEKDGKPALWFIVKGDGLCASIILEADRQGKMGDLIKKRGVSYRGAEFVGLQFDIHRDYGKTEFIFRDYRRIVD